MDPRPNVLWIITDDQTRKSLKAMPHTLRLVAEPGVLFRNGYAAVPWCGPARASMMTSRYPHNHHCFTNNTLPKFLEQGLDQDTVATRMKAAGYVNAYFGKYMNAHGSRPEYVAPGWDRWVVRFDPDRTPYNIDGRVVDVADDRRVSDAFAGRRLARFFRRHVHTPWFAVFAPTTPHNPYTPSQRHRHDYDDVVWDPPSLNEPNMGDKPEWMRSLEPKDRKRMQRAWRGMLEELRDLDDQIRGLVQTLRDTGQLDNTVIMLVSDNGYMLGEHRLFRKEQPYEESAGVPFIVRGPGFEPGVSRALVSQVDLMPTTLQVAGLDPDEGRDLDGRSLLPHLRSGDWSGWRRRLLVENPNLGWAMLREGQLSFIHQYERGGLELYDLAADPYQMRSLHRTVDTSDHLERLQALRTAAGRPLRALEG
jgi:arylsulfatase A-like enzyme